MRVAFSWPLNLALCAATTAALFLAAAKFHGRQIRLERELAGFWTVDFRRENPPFVEQLWRADRRHYWSTAALSALALFGYFIATSRTAWPGWREELGGASYWAAAVPFALAWSMTVAFAANGVASWIRLVRSPAWRTALPAGAPHWKVNARRGSRLWAAIVSAIGLALAWASL